MPVSRTRLKRNKSNNETIGKSDKHRSQFVQAANKNERNREREKRRQGILPSIETAAEKVFGKLNSKK